MGFNSGFKGLITIRLATCFDSTGSSSGLHYEPVNKFNAHGSVHRDNILVYNSNKMHKLNKLCDLCILLELYNRKISVLYHNNSEFQLYAIVTP